MKVILKGFVKGILSCLIIAIAVGAFCYFSGLLDWIKRPGKDPQITAESVIGEPEKDPESLRNEENATEETSEDEILGDAKDVNAFEEGIPDAESIKLLFGGDLLPTSTLLEKYQKKGITAAISEDLLDHLEAADIFMVNQEFPFGVTGEPMEDKQFTFRLHPSYVNVVKEMGIDVVTLANNHVLDYGRAPLKETLETLDKADILHVGAGEDLEEASAPVFLEAGGKTFGFLGASRVIPVSSWAATSRQSGLFTTYDAALLLKKIEETKPECDFLVIYVHWGLEYQQLPEEYQKELAHAYIDAGADMVVGSHPHVLQGVEYYKDKPILYSLGNFVFSNGVYDTMLAEMTIAGDLGQLRLIPCHSSQNQMSYLSDTAAFYKQIEEISFDVKIDEEGVVHW